ncbi:MAG: neutral/alkaline non-lysosomal ceramidase N-terminal domain-containing protein [Planctomycetia bacterium]|nr:neutral/alkaline non-lysosomal ceramidase N-terminal domain-containing protein [Planctomycetia bacterium]
MKRYSNTISAVTILSTLFFIGFAMEGYGNSSVKNEKLIRVGAASEDITPEPGVYLAGYASRTEPSTGIRGNLFTHVLYIEKDNERLIWIVCDLLGFDYEDVQVIQNILAEKYQLQPWQVVVSATHTHSAPTVQAIGSEKETKYMNDLLYPQIFKAVDRAVGNAEDCEMILVEGYSELAHDRRNAPVPGDGAAPNPDRSKAFVDPRVPSVAFKKLDGSFKCILIQYAMHPTSWGDLNMGPEWPGATAISIKKSFGDSVEPFVLQGAAGNLGSPKRKATPEEMQSWGDELVASVDEKIKSSEASESSSFAVRHQTIRVALTVKNEQEVKEEAAEYKKIYASNLRILENTVLPWEKIQLQRLKDGTADHIDAQVVAIRFGDHVFVTTPFETFCHLNRECRKHVSHNVHIIGYTNGVYNYFPTKDAIDQGGYEPQAYLWYFRFPCAYGALEQFAQDIAPLINSTFINEE